MKFYQPKTVVRYAFYAFVFSIPLEALNIGIRIQNFTLTKMVGLIFIGVALVQRRVWFRQPPPAFWCFVGYGYLYLMFSIADDPKFDGDTVWRISTLVQLLVMFWISFNLMCYDGVARGALLALTASCLSIGVLVMLGIMGTDSGHGRITGIAGVNPNTFATVISCGLLALVGLTYSGKLKDRKLRLVAWPAVGVMAITIVNTGSRGIMVALVVALLALLLKADILLSNPKAVLLVLLAIVLGIWTSFQSEAVRVRWERTVATGDTTGRDLIWASSLEMVLERPLGGWGPHSYLYELGSRTGKRGGIRGPHNGYLAILLETGFLGGIVFFSGLWLCWRRAWRARAGVWGRLPIAMMLLILMANLSGAIFYQKLSWLVLAYGLASSSGVANSRIGEAVGSPRRLIPNTDPKKVWTAVGSPSQNL